MEEIYRALLVGTRDYVTKNGFKHVVIGLSGGMRAPAQEANWPPKTREFIVNQEVEVVSSFPFIPEITPGTVGPIFEMRCYSLAPGSLPGSFRLSRLSIER